MPILFAAALLVQTGIVSPAASTDIAAMAALYDEVCLKTFPVDTGIDALMASKNATPISAEKVGISLRNDPGRGWEVVQGGQSFTVLLELPPYHACSVRASTPTASKLDLAAYRVVADAYKASHRGFVAEPAVDVDRGGIRIHAEVDARPLPTGGGELLMVINQQVVDPSKLAPGTTGTPLRFVHQIKTAN